MTTPIPNTNNIKSRGGRIAVAVFVAAVFVFLLIVFIIKNI